VIAIATLDRRGDERDVLVRLYVRVLCATAAIVGVLVALNVSQIFDIDPRAFRLIHLALVTPSTLPIAVPIGLAIGVALGLKGRPTTTAKNAILVTAFAVSILSFGTMEWVMPDANQSFRQAMFNARASRVAVMAQGRGGGVIRGVNEMQLSALRREAQFASALNHPGRMRRSAWKYHLRWALPLAAPVLTFLAFALIDRRVSRSVGLVTASCVAYFGLTIFSLVLVFEFPRLPPVVGAWLTNIVFVGITMFVSAGLKPCATATTGGGDCRP
jgi:lipopolysaccharide export LptBFGC system permease protein LptF